MPRRWTKTEEDEKRKQLRNLYVEQNQTIAQIAKLIHCGETTIYDRLVRLGIPISRSTKARYNNQRINISIPEPSADLAEFIGLLLGDGHLTPTQVTVTLGKKDQYATAVRELIERLFGITPKSVFSKKGDETIYFGSTVIVRWLLAMGLAKNKVRAQVSVPAWILRSEQYTRAALRGLFDTDGSVYRVRSGLQISFTNHSRPLLIMVRNMLQNLHFHPSQVSGPRLYLTRKEDCARFFREIGFKNQKHQERFYNFSKQLGRVV